MDGLTEKIAAIVEEANQDGAFRQQLLDEPLACLKARGLGGFKPRCNRGLMFSALRLAC